ncbi:ATP-binding protein [Spirulina sp. CS-785/01]|uniref:ATP-binding protein n=1 Tax=Spirulina sp. CS-785/01 TaxID=3021716 RepID=UPI00232CEA7C|nr:ATP-binding protein [Spirulina sp. CS-785/01]MDB9314778.1 ATP-binding protein [Spirulina sp. CS-785/01]
MIFTRYNIIIRITLAMVIVVVSVLFYWQFNAQYHYEINQIKNELKEEVTTLDKTLKNTTSYIEQMQFRATSFYEISQITAFESIIFDHLTEYEENQQTYFGLETIPEPYNAKLVGNLTGIGTLEGRSSDFYREIEMALSLNSVFQSALKVLPNDVWTYYLSGHKFLNLYPWVSSEQFHFTLDLLSYDFFRLGLPEHNPDHQLFWTSIYLDPATNILMVTCGAPVYENKQFRGVVAIDMTLDTLNQMISQSKLTRGQLFLVNENAQLLADPLLAHTSNQDIVQFKEVLPDAIPPEKVAPLLSSETLQTQEFGSYLLFAVPVNQAPWKLTLCLEKKTLILPILAQISLGLGLLLMGLTLLLILANQVIYREFIVPANLLINYIETVSQNQDNDIPIVPKDWQFSFQTIRRIFQANRKITAELVQQEKMSSLGQLVAGIAHEINNPINFIYGNLPYVKNYTKDLLYLLHIYQQKYTPDQEIKQTIQEIDLEFLEEDLPKLLHSMEVGSDRIREIILSLRNFSRLDEAEKKKVQLHQGLESTLTILENRLKLNEDHPDIQIKKHYGDLPPVECYAGQLNQVFYNIIANALDALKNSPKPEKWIEIKTEFLEPEKVSVKITDNGEGISEKDQAHIFDPFFTTKPVGQGTGLGLSISYQIIVDKHGGSLDCHSTPKEGTTFLITIPVYSSG